MSFRLQLSLNGDMLPAMSFKRATNRALTTTQGDRFHIRRSHLFTWLGVAVALFFAGVALGDSDSVGAAEADGVLFGAYAQPRGGQSDIQAVQALESSLGSKLPIVRDFTKWDSKIDNRFSNWVVDGDRRLMISIKPKRGNGQEVRWSEIASARPGSKVHNEILSLARGVKALDGEVWLTFHHEPEAKDRQSFGTNSDYKAAWRKIHDVFQAEQVDAQWVWTMTSWSFEVSTTDRRSAGKWYPGDAYVDYLGADPYNWNQCRGNDKERWQSLERIIEPFVEFAEQHPDKQLVLPEFGSDEGTRGQKAAWLDAVRSYMKRPANTARFAAIIYFHDVHEGDAACTWWLDSSSETLAAARRIAADPHFDRNTDGRVAVPAPTPNPDPGPACTVRRTANGDQITWDDRGDGWRWNIRRNGKWLAGTRAETYLNTLATTGNYVVIGRESGKRVDLSCIRIA